MVKFYILHTLLLEVLYMGLASNIVILNAYNEEWDKLFVTEKIILSGILEGIYRDIVHVGSTSIPNIPCAKPVIDIAVGVHDYECMQQAKLLLLNYGYYHNPRAGSEDRLYFAKGNSDNRIYNIHVEIIDGVSWKNHIKFKEFLIKNPQYITKYCELKKKLASEFYDDRDKYKEGKSKFIEDILKKAMIESSV